MQNGETQSPDNQGNYFHKYFQYASFIISCYKKNEPFHLFLKRYFSANKKHGSKDRKLITVLCYNYFRLGFGVSSTADNTEKFLLSAFLCEKVHSSLLQFFKPGWNASISLPLNEKLQLVKKEFDTEKIFPLSDEVSNEINFQNFSLSFLIRPKLFIRIRPGFKALVTGKIKKAGFLFEELSENCIAFSNNEKVSDILEIDKEAVVQDFNSQKTLDILKPFEINKASAISIWDCCSGSGGKSILAFDIFKNIKLTVSDKRKNILENLYRRFAKAGLKNYNSIVADLSGRLPEEAGERYDLIIADVPCSGSGTWERTPEQLIFFKKNEIGKYASLQKKIIENTVPSLKNKGYLLYITCSVFKKENEENVYFVQQNLKLDLIKLEYLKGYEMQADTLFVALFKKNG
jgi:16S rRNA (cytosine967-C5)-methyltransferase